MARVAITALLLAMGCGPGLLEAPTFTLTPAAPTTVDDIVVTEASCEDCTYRWFQGGTLVPGLTGDTVPATHTTRDETWVVLVAEADGPPTEAKVTVGNAAPVVISVHLHPEVIRTDDDLTVIVESEDADGDDTEPPTVTWYVNEVQGETGPTLSGDQFDKGDDVHAEVMVSDGSVPSHPVTSSTSTVVNSPPTEPGLTIEALPGVGLQCRISSPAIDADDDDLEHSFTWTLDGAPFTDTDELQEEVYPDDTVVVESFELGQLWGGRVEVTEIDEGDAVPVVATATYEVLDREWALDLDATGGFVVVDSIPEMNVGYDDVVVEFVLLQTRQDDGGSTLSRRGPVNNYVLLEAIHDDAGWLPQISLYSVEAGAQMLLVCQGEEAVAYDTYVHLAFQRAGSDKGGSGMPKSGGISRLPEIFVDGAKVDVACTLSVGGGEAMGRTSPLGMKIQNTWPWTIGWGDAREPDEATVGGGAFGGSLGSFRYSDELIYPTGFEPSLPLSTGAHTVVNFLLEEGTGMALLDAKTGAVGGYVDNAEAWGPVPGVCPDVMAGQGVRAHMAFEDDLTEDLSEFGGTTNAVAPTFKPGPSGHGRALSMSPVGGEGDWVHWAGLDIDGDGLSIGAWVKIGGAVDNAWTIVSALSDLGLWTFGVADYSGSAEGVELFFRADPTAGGQGILTCADAGLEIGTWHHVGVTWGGHLGASVEFYVDGVPCMPELSSNWEDEISIFPVDEGWVGGQWGNEDQNLQGLVDEVWISGTQLSGQTMDELSICTDD